MTSQSGLGADTTSSAKEAKALEHWISAVKLHNDWYERHYS